MREKIAVIVDDASKKGGLYDQAKSDVKSGDEKVNLIEKNIDPKKDIM